MIFLTVCRSRHPPRLTFFVKRVTLIPFTAIVDGVAKSPPYGVMLFFQDLDLQDVGLRP